MGLTEGGTNFVSSVLSVRQTCQVETLNKQLYIPVWKSGERGLCWRYKFVNFQHLDDIKALGLDKIMKGASLDREEA